MKEVKENKSNICPYCHKVMTEFEGTSETTEDKHIITCAYCCKEYYYLDKEMRRVKKNGS